MIDNSSALWILEKEQLTESDKNFIKKHIETCTEIMKTQEVEILYLKDCVENAKYFDYKVSQVRDMLSSPGAHTKLDEILAYVRNSGA